MPGKPPTEEAMQKQEAIGIIRASRFVRRFAHDTKPITLETLCDIHKQIFKEAWSDIAGKFRTENLEITDSKHLPPHHSSVHEMMQQVDTELRARLDQLKSVTPLTRIGNESSEENIQMIDKIIETAAWIHHKITFIHPFREGNGRTARLAANLILERFGLVGISIKVERENKNRYRAALAQSDQHNDLEPLKALIYEGLIDRYSGVPMKYPDKHH